MGRLSGLGVALLVAGLLLGCASPRPGVVHVVRQEENLFRIARHYDVAVTEILDANDIEDVTDLPVGRELWIPNAGATRPPPRALRPPVATRAQAEADAIRHGGLRFGWPLRGRLTSPYGPRSGRNHDGIDIAANRGTLVRAAEAGRVVFSGRMGGYGTAIVIRHNDAYATVYAHHSRNRVEKGGFVDRGSVVGEVGSTGRATGPHLHFEVRRDDVAQDPLLFLP
jgi:LysM repeat protein